MLKETAADQAGAPSAIRRQSAVVGVDIGGTFTDLVGYRDGVIVTSKTSTVPADPTEGIADALKLADCDLAAMDELIHGSTIAINTVLEHKGAKTALVTTAGMRDVYAIGRGNRPDAFNLFFHRPRPLVPRELTFELAERMTAAGKVLMPLDQAEVAALAGKISGLGVEAVAVCLLHAYGNPAHEILAGEMLRRALPGVFITLSHEILREFREYERTSTTVLNAFVGPRVSRYLSRLEEFADKSRFAGQVAIMRSNGGTMSVGEARRAPVAMMESGPVAGMIGAGRIAQTSRHRTRHRLRHGRHHRQDVADHRRRCADRRRLRYRRRFQRPADAIAGRRHRRGRRRRRLDRLVRRSTGGLHVGPHSAGADPGPACYGRGGTEADRDRCRSRARPAQRHALSRRPHERSIAPARRRAIAGAARQQLDLDAMRTALGIATISDAAMSLAVRAVSVKRGIDPRDTTMIAFGGAGPLHAVAIAREISIPKVIIPKLPGAFSALGMLMAEWRQDFVRTLIGELGRIDAQTAAMAFSELRAAGDKALARDGLGDGEFSFAADLRYRGQEHTIAIAVADVRRTDRRH